MFKIVFFVNLRLGNLHVELKECPQETVQAGINAKQGLNPPAFTFELYSCVDLNVFCVLAWI